MSLLTLYWLRLLAAALALLFAVCYLAGSEVFALGGFALLAAGGTAVGIGLGRGTLPASCDLCGAAAVIGAEYGAGFANAKLILNCPRCGRVVNGRPGSMKPQQE